MTNGRSVAGEVPEGVELLSSQVLEMDDLALLLEKVVGWKQDVGLVDPWLIEKWSRYCDELVGAKLAVPCTFNEVLKIVREVISAYAYRSVRISQVGSNM